MNNKKSFYFNPLTENFLVEYRGNFKDQIDKVSYATGDIISNTLAVISLLPEDRDKLLKDVPSIIYIDFRMMVILQNISPTYVDNVNNIKMNPYLNLDGSGITIGIIDTGIDYLNEEFMWEDGTSRILKIWDQSITDSSDDNSDIFIGKVYSNDEINSAIKAYHNNENPYAIVPSRDERGHGTKIAGIIGGRGATNEFQGIANKCNFIIVKLLESSNFKAILKDNLIDDIPVYNISECVAGLEFLKKEFFKLKNQAMVIYMGLGSTEGSHDGKNLISRYLNSLALIRGLCLVTGVGNEGASEGHVTGYIKSKDDISTQQLKIPRPIKHLRFNVWIQKPNNTSIEITSPSGASSQVIKSKINKIEKYKFVFTGTEITVSYRLPDNFTGSNVISIEFKDLKPGIWKIKLIGEYILGGRYDIWLPPSVTLPEGLGFMEPTSNNTLTIPATAQNTLAVSYYGENNAILSSSGKGWGYSSSKVKPDLSTIGINILTTKPGGGLTTISGSSAATAIAVGGCALLLQWGIIKNNDISMYTNKIRSYLIYGTLRNPNYKYPNRDLGYGEFNLLGTFNSIAKIYNNKTQLSTLANIRSYNNMPNKEYKEYTLNNMFIRIPITILGEFQ